MLVPVTSVVVFTLNCSFYPTTSAVPPVSFLILHPRDTNSVVTRQWDKRKTAVFPNSLKNPWSPVGPKLAFSHLIQFPKLNWIFFFFIQTGPSTPLYANLPLSRYIFSPLCFRFLSYDFGGRNKEELLYTAAVRIYVIYKKICRND